MPSDTTRRRSPKKYITEIQVKENGKYLEARMMFLTPKLKEKYDNKQDKLVLGPGLRLIDGRLELTHIDTMSTFIDNVKRDNGFYIDDQGVIYLFAGDKLTSYTSQGPEFYTWDNGQSKYVKSREGSDLKGVIYNYIRSKLAMNLTTLTSGKMLDATQGKLLNDRLTELENKGGLVKTVNNIEPDSRGNITLVIDPYPTDPIVDFRAEETDDNKIKLDWVNPRDRDFEGVLIVKNTSRFPTDKEDGTVVYDGKENTTIDGDSLVAGQKNYYRAFPYDFYGNYNKSGGQQVIGVVRASQTAPFKPVIDDVTYNSVTLEKHEGFEYKVDQGAWQDSNIFTNLESSKGYTFYQRRAGTETHKPSPSSEGQWTSTEDPPYWTYTAIINEKNENPETSVRYADDAISMQPGDERFDEAFGFYPVMLDKDGNELQKLNPHNYAEDIEGNPVDISSGDGGNVMVAFPRMGYKFERKGDEVYVSLTNEPNRDGFAYYAHTRKSYPDGYYENLPIGEEITEDMDVFYIGVFPTTDRLNDNISMKSVSVPSDYIKEDDINSGHILTYNAILMDESKFNKNYSIWGYYQVTLLQVMALIKFKTRDLKSVLGRGIGWVGGDNEPNYQASQKYIPGNSDLTIGPYSSPIHGREERVSLFGIHDFYGMNITYVAGAGVLRNGYKISTSLNMGYFKRNVDDSIRDGMEIGNILDTISSYRGSVDKILATNKAGFLLDFDHYNAKDDNVYPSNTHYGMFSYDMGMKSYLQILKIINNPWLLELHNINDSDHNEYSNQNGLARIMYL